MDDHVETPEDYPFEDVVSHWDVVIEEMAATAEEYADEGWTTVTLHPGDVSVSAGEKPNANTGFDVLVPGEEFRALRAAVEDRTFDSYEVLRTVEQGIVFLLTVLTDAEDDVAVFVPAYYDVDETDALQVAVENDDGRLRTHVRQLREGERVEFSHEDPSLFFPEEYEDVV